MSEQIKALIRTLAEDACKARNIELDSEGLTKLTEQAYGAMGDAFYKAVRKLEPKEKEGPPFETNVLRPDYEASEEARQLAKAEEDEEPEPHKRKGKKG